MFRRSQHRVARPVRGVAWSITDEALRRIDEHVAAHIPERGGALVAARDSRYVVDFLPDPRPGEGVSYWHSDGLRTGLSRYLAGHSTRRFGGTLHSHPGNYCEPSPQDHNAFASTLEANPGVREALFPIVVQRGPDALGDVLRLGEDHLVELPHGTFAGYTTVPDAHGVEVRPAPMHVVPLREDVETAVQRLAMAPEGAAAGTTFELEFEGRYLPAVPVAVGRRQVIAVFPETYPSSAPLLVGPDGVTTPEWMSGSDSGTSLASAIEALITRREAAFSRDDAPVGDAAPTPAAEADRADAADRAPAADRADAADPDGRDAETLESRLALHLPEGVAARYLVVGAGSVGSNAAELLVRSGVRHLTVVDFDTVATANLSRTVFTQADVGRRKVEALADRLLAIAPGIDVTPIDASIQELDLAVLDGVDVAVLGADDLAAEAWLGHHLYARGIRAVSVKMFARGDAGEVVVVDPQVETACLRCVLGEPSAARGTTDYGTGRLVAAPALGSDIVATVARGVKVALALGQNSGPLAEWIEALLAERRTYFQHANVADWPFLEAAKGGAVRPFDAAWLPTESDPGCAVCGPERIEPSAHFGLEMPEALPPGVVADAAVA